MNIINKIVKYLDDHQVDRHRYSFSIVEDKNTIFNSIFSCIFYQSYVYPNIFLFSYKTIFSYPNQNQEYPMDLDALYNIIYCLVTDRFFLTNKFYLTNKKKYYLIGSNNISDIFINLPFYDFIEYPINNYFIDYFIFEREKDFFKFPNTNLYLNRPVRLTFVEKKYFKRLKRKLSKVKDFKFEIITKYSDENNEEQYLYIIYYFTDEQLKEFIKFYNNAHILKNKKLLKYLHINSTIHDIIIDIKDNIENKFFNIKNKFIEKFKKG